MKRSILFLSLLGLLPPIQGFCQYTVTNLDTAVWDTNWQVNFDIDNDGTDDLYFYQGGWPIDSYVMMGVALSDSIHLSQNTLNNNSFNFVSWNDSLAWIAETMAINPDGLNSSPGGMNIVKYVGYYKTISPTDSIFGYFTIKPFLGPYLNTSFGDTLFIYNHVQATTVNSPLDAGVNCFFDLNSANNSSCISCNGTIEAISYGGTPPFTYNWSNGATAQIIDSICIGNYSITITDSLGCTWTDSTYIDSISAGFNFSIQGTPGSGCNSAIQATTTAGDPPFSYLWSTGDTTDFIFALCDGWYFLSLTDSSGCTYSDSILINNDTSFATSASPYISPNSSCSGPCNGMFDIWISGGVPPYSIEASNGTIYNTSGQHVIAENICEGWNYYTVTDSTGAVVSNQIYIESAIPFSFSSSTTPATCSSCNNGSILTTVTGGSPPYTFYLNGGTVNASGNFTGLSPGTYQVCVADGGLCYSCDSITVGNSDPCLNSNLQITCNMDSISCNSCSDGSIEILGSGGTAPYNYTIDGGLTYQFSNIFAGLPPGNYIACIQDSDGCETCLNVTLDSIVCNLNFTHSIENSITCYNDCNASILFNISNAAAPYSFSSSSGIVTQIGVDVFLVENLCSENVVIEVVGSDSCSYSDTVFVSQPDSLHFTGSQLSLASCSTCLNGSILLNVVGGSPPYLVDWSNFSSSETTIQADSLSSGSGVVCVTDASGCQFCDSVTVDFIDDSGLETSSIKCEIYPNPADDKIAVESTVKITTFEILDASGKLISSTIANSSEFEINTSILPSGVYLIRMTLENSIIKRKLVVY